MSGAWPELLRKRVHFSSWYLKTLRPFKTLETLKNKYLSKSKRGYTYPRKPNATLMKLLKKMVEEGYDIRTTRNNKVISQINRKNLIITTSSFIFDIYLFDYLNMN